MASQAAVRGLRTPATKHVLLDKLKVAVRLELVTARACAPAGCAWRVGTWFAGLYLFGRVTDSKGALFPADSCNHCNYTCPVTSTA